MSLKSNRIKHKLKKTIIYMIYQQKHAKYLTKAIGELFTTSKIITI